MLGFQVKKCHICGKRASISLTQIINGQISELALCESCAKEKGIFDPQTLTFAEKFFPEDIKAKVDKIVRELAGMQQNEATNAAKDEQRDLLVRCPVCQFSLSAHRKTGRLGCPSCYTVFARELAQEAGVVNSDGADSPADERTELERELQQAIEREDYESAAVLRDRIRQLNDAPHS